MYKTIFMWAMIWLATPFASFSQTIEEPSDTIPSIDLDELVVKARPVVKLSDGNAYIPSSDKKQSSTSGINLLHKMQLPRISVNQMTGEVTLSGGGNVRLCLNGVEVSSAEIAAIRPGDVIRVEYHDNPGAKYSGADAVIDYITRRHDSGGNLSAETMDMIGDGKWVSMDNISGQYSNGSSTFSLNAGFLGLHRDNWLRDYDEVWNYPDGTVTRHEEGLPVTIGNYGFESALNYSLQNARVGLLNIRATYSQNYVPAKEEGDRHTLLSTSESDRLTEINEHTRERESSPTLGVFYRKAVGKGELTASLTGAYLHSHSSHSYSESVDGNEITSIFSDVEGDKYSLYAEGYYELPVGASLITAGARHQQSHTANCYTGSENMEVSINQNQTSIFGEYTVRLNNWSLLGNLTLGRFHSAQDNVAYTHYSVLPTIGAGWNPADNFCIRYDLKMERQHPSVAALSDVEQTVQPGFIRRGNPSLKSYGVIDQRLNLSWNRGVFSADLMVDHRHEHNPVMPTILYNGRQFVSTYENQRSFQELRGELSLGLHLWSDHLTILLMPNWSRYFSHGNSYWHVRDIFHMGGSIDFSYGHWIANASVMTGAATSMYGEEIINEKDMNCILVGYQTKVWSVQAGVFNAFMKDYWMKTENMSVLTPYTSKAHCGKNMYGAIKLTLNLDFGRQRELVEMPDQYTHEMDSGIVNGLK